MSHGKQFTLYTHVGGPNGWKVAILCDYLGLTYEPVYLNFQSGDQKKPEHTKLNPNGRIPTIIDHKNNDYVLWESNAILLYIIDKYDTEKKLSVTSEGDKYHLLQWLFFQSSGQGPYYGQAAWFSMYHAEKIPSAIERYQKEIIRVLGVLESVLSKQEYLVGNKLTIADLSFITWNNFAVQRLINEYENFNFEKDFPATAKWHAALNAVPAVKKNVDERTALLAKA